MVYSRILTRLVNTPLAISQDKLSIITTNVTLPLLQGRDIPSLESKAIVMSEDGEDDTSSSPKVGVIKVFDSLVSHNGAGDSGSTSYERIKSSIDYYVKEEVTTIVFDIKSPGGEVEGLFELASYIHSIPETYGIDTIAVATGNMTSAAYVIGAACQKVLGTEASIIGSIGVIMTLVDATAADKKAGLTYKIMRSKDEKALINPHEGLTDKAVADATKMLGQLDELMNRTVNTYRPSLSIEKIVSLKGNTVLGKEAAEIGLTDGVVSSLQEVLNGLANVSTTKGVKMTTQLSAEEEINLLKAQLAEKDNLLASAKSAAQAEEQSRFQGILAAATTYGIPNASAIAQKYFGAGMSVVQASDQLALLKETMQLANPSPTVNALDTTVTANVYGSEEVDEITQLCDKIGARAKEKFNVDANAHEAEVFDALVNMGF